MKNNKKIASLLLSGVMVAGMIPTNVLANEAADAVTNNQNQVVTNDGSKAETKVWKVTKLTLTPASKEITEGTKSVDPTLDGTATSTEETEETEDTNGKPAIVTVTATKGTPNSQTINVFNEIISGTVTINGLGELKAGDTVTVTASAADGVKATSTITVNKKNDEKLNDIKVTFKKGSYVDSIENTTVTIKEKEEGKGVKLSEFTKKADIDFKKGYKLDEYRDSDKDKRINSSDMITKDTKVEVIGKKDKDSNHWDDDKDDYKRVYPTNLERDGRYAKGTLKSYKNTKVYIYESTSDYRDDRSTLGSGYTDSNGDFRINVGSNYSNSEVKNFAYYVDEDSKSKDDLKEVYPKNVELYGKSSGEYRDVKGTLKDYKNEKIYVYLKGNEKGNGKVDKDGDFDFRLSKYIDDKYDEDDLRFYVDDDTKSSSDSIFITRAIGGETKVEGKDAGKDATVEVKDSRSIKLGSTTADKDGKFTVSLNRALVGGETITVTSKVSGKSETKIDYIVPGFGGNINTPSVNTNGYIKGYSDGSFQPNGNMTRAEAAVMMARLKNGSDNFNTSEITRFTDANNKWYSKGVNYAVGQGLINGYEDGTFRPDEKITRAEFTQMIANDIKTNGTKAISFNDVNNHWAKPAIEKVAGNGIINGYEDNSFRPNNNITRAEAVKMLNGISNRPEGSRTNTFNDVRPSDWFYNDVMKAAN